MTLVVGVAIGYTAAVIVTPGVVAPSMTPAPGDRTVRSTTTTTTVDTPSTTAEAQPETYLVWSTGGLTEEVLVGLRDGFTDLSVVRGDSVEMEASGDWVVPLDAVAIDPEAHRPFDPGDSLVDLRPGTVALGETSADFRDVGVGDSLTISGESYEVTGIAPDEVVGAAEVVFATADEDSPVVTERYALVSTDLDRTEFENTVRGLYEGPAPLRIRSEDETPWLRHGDAVLPQIFIKNALGEFRYTNRAGSEFAQDPDFIEANIVDEEVPILGTVTCHATVVEMLRGALGDLVDDGVGHLVDPTGFAGCWNPRYIRATTGTSAGISRHAWGAAVDLNTRSNPVGSAGTQDPRLVSTVLDWGFTWGGDWLVPDPMHFEYGIAP